MGVKYLSFLASPAIIVNDHQSMNILYYIGQYAGSKHGELKFDSMPDDYQHAFVAILVDLTHFIHDHMKELLKGYSAATAVGGTHGGSNMSLNDLEKQTINGAKLVKRDIYLYTTIASLTMNYSNVSIRFCQLFCERADGAGVKNLVNFIRNDFFSDHLVTKLKRGQSSKMLDQCYANVIGALQTLSRDIKYRRTWEDMAAVDALVHFSQKVASCDQNLLTAVYMIIANIASDEQMETLQAVKVYYKSIEISITIIFLYLTIKKGQYRVLFSVASRMSHSVEKGS